MAELIQVERELKRDAFGRVELLVHAARGERRIRRVAAGGGLPGSGSIARVLLRREARALTALASLAYVPLPTPDSAWTRAPSLDGEVPPPGQVLVRAFVSGAPLHLAEVLPEDFFELLAALVGEAHALGVCHNDLHKEQNVMVGEDGRPWLIDFQLASCHTLPTAAGRGSASFRARCRDDLRHVHKHLRRYTRDGRGAHAHGPAGARAEQRLPRSRTALIWRRTGKPLYNLVTRGLLRTRDGEQRRDSAGPWPTWSAPLGPPPSA